MADAAAPAFLGVERSLTGRRWRSRVTDDRLAQALSQRLGLPELVGRVLAARGVSLDDAELYMAPTLKALLPDPSRFLDMDRAAARLVRAVTAGERIAIFGDYDVDGATSSALLIRFFRHIGIEPRLYIPDRMVEGYGPNIPAMQRLADEGVRLVITVDCGTLAFQPLAAAREAGLDVLVADHHLAEPELPDAFALVNPNRLDEVVGHRQLAAVGVTFLLIVAANRALRAAGWYGPGRSEPDLMAWLDLVALGTICDVVPLTGLNRALVAQGLKVMAQRRNPGIAALADIAGLSEKPGCYHCGFLLGPRVNAGGRVGRADLGARLLSTDDAAEAASLAAELDRHNRERQAIEAQVLEQALAQVADGIEGAVAVVAGEGWHPGVVGIVAARVREATNRPSLVIAVDENGVAKGSGRSVPGIDLGTAVVAALQAGILVNGGGHAMAAGVTLHASRIGELKEFLDARLATPVAALGDVRSLGLDGAVSVDGANAQLLELLDRAGPYGSGNAEPRLVLPQARVVDASIVGEKHVRVVLSGMGGGRLKGIAFRALDNELGKFLLGPGRDGLHVAGHLRADNWRGERRVQLVIEDAAPLR